MEQTSLLKFIESVQKTWGPLNSELVSKSQTYLEELAKAPISEAWLKALKLTPHESLEVYRDPKHGFLLLAHTETKGLYRPPHDHGAGWVIYAVQSGEMEMGTFTRVEKDSGEFEIVRRDKYRVNKGESRIYLPGDIHDTRCISDSVLMLRLTSVDLKAEQKAGRMHRYAEVK